MTQDVQRDGSAEKASLIDAAAAWVPPWERPRRPAEGDEGADGVPPGPDHAAAPAPEPAPQPRPATSPGIDPDPEPATDAAAFPEPEPDDAGRAEPEPEDAGRPEPEPEDAGRPEPLPDAAPAEPAAGVPEGDLRPALEAILLVVDEPVGEPLLADVLGHPVERITAELDALAADYSAARRGYDLRRAAGGWRLYTRSDFAGYVERFVLDGQSVRLTQAALETLAVVAYKQPVTRARISAIRGVNCDGVVRTLVGRGLIEECGAEPESGAHLYRTTGLFLEKLGLDSVDELPPLAPFLPDNVDEVDAEH